MRFIKVLWVLVTLFLVVAAVACGAAAAPAPQIVEKEVIKEVVVTPTPGPTPMPVVVEKEVIKEVIKVVVAPPVPAVNCDQFPGKGSKKDPYLVNRIVEGDLEVTSGVCQVSGTVMGDVRVGNNTPECADRTLKYTALGVAEGAIKGNIHASGQACVMVWLGENSTVEGNVVYDALGNMVFKNVVGGEPKDPAEIGEFAGATINGDLEMRDGFLSASGVSLKNHVVGRVICDGGRPKKLPSSRDDWDGDGKDDGRIGGNYECMAADLEPEPLKFSVVDVKDLPDLLDIRGQSTLVRTDGGVMGSFNASGLEPGVWTWWWVFYNNPDACQHPKFVGMGSQISLCSKPDKASSETGRSAGWGGGTIVTEDGIGNFTAVQDFGTEAPGSPVSAKLCRPKLTNLLGAEVHIVLRYHGPADDALLSEQLFTWGGGCDYDQAALGNRGAIGTFKCTDQLAAIHPPLK